MVDFNFNHNFVTGQRFYIIELLDFFQNEHFRPVEEQV